MKHPIPVARLVVPGSPLKRQVSWWISTRLSGIDTAPRKAMEASSPWKGISRFWFGFVGLFFFSNYTGKALMIMGILVFWLHGYPIHDCATTLVSSMSGWIFNAWKEISKWVENWLRCSASLQTNFFSCSTTGVLAKQLRGCELNQSSCYVLTCLDLLQHTQFHLFSSSVHSVLQ